jgi:predicted phage terminase large subunit-like protein
MADGFAPNQGPQREFLATRADVAFYGGAAGAGKSYAITLDVLRHAHRKGFGAIVLRREATRLTGSGSLWEEMHGVYPNVRGLTATSRESPALEWRFNGASLVELRHLQHEKDVHAHQGKQYAGIYFDEVTEFTGSQFWYMLSRLRTTCGIRPYVRGTCNPDPDSFVKGMIEWWLDDVGFPIPERSGVLRWFIRDGDDLVWFDSEAEAREKYPSRNPLSFTFIAASLADNPRGDPTYRDKLEALPRVERERLLGGNWNIRPAAGLYFPRRCFEVVERVPGPVTMTVRAWDKAATRPHPGNPDPDWTRGAKVSRLRDGRFVVEHVEGLRGSPGEVEQAILAIAAQDGPSVPVVVWQDPGQAGVVDRDATLRALSGFQVRSIRASRDKLAYAGVWAPHVEAGRVLLVRGAWTDAFLAEAESFPEGKHDDAVDAVSLAFQALTESRYAEALAKAKSWL